MRTLVLLLAALALGVTPLHAAAQSQGDGSVVDVTDARHPDTVLVDRAFRVTVELVNHARDAKDVYLFGAAYDPGSACEDGFRAFTHRVQAVVRVEPGERVTYPQAEDGPWWHVVNADAAGSGGPLAFCVLAAESESGPNARLTYFDKLARDVTVRLENARPVADFSWTPRAPRALEPVTFTADAEDADGDALTFEWDFGHATASGRATATGREVEHAFYPDGAFRVTLRVSDAWDTAIAEHAVTVAPERAGAAQGDGGNSRFLPALPLLAGVGVTVALARALNPPRRRP